MAAGENPTGTAAQAPLWRRMTASQSRIVAGPQVLQSWLVALRTRQRSGDRDPQAILEHDSPSLSPQSSQQMGRGSCQGAWGASKEIQNMEVKLCSTSGDYCWEETSRSGAGHGHKMVLTYMKTMMITSRGTVRKLGFSQKAGRLWNQMKKMSIRFGLAEKSV